MPTDPEGPQTYVCVFCWPHRDRDGTTRRHCEMCVGRDTDRWCEHDCPWLGGDRR